MFIKVDVNERLCYFNFMLLMPRANANDHANAHVANANAVAYDNDHANANAYTHANANAYEHANDDAVVVACYTPIVTATTASSSFQPLQQYKINDPPVANIGQISHDVQHSKRPERV